MIFKSPLDLVLDDIFLELDDFLPERNIFLKLEGFNPGGSIKMKTAIGLIENLRQNKVLSPNSTIIESSSGNLGIALSIVCAFYGYNFICVTDPNAAPQKIDLIRAYGAEVIKITNKDQNGGYLESRIKFIKERLVRDPSLVWTNQYANPANKLAHKNTTAKEIFKLLGEKLDFLFVGAGTTGTLMGCAEYIKENNIKTKIIAVDAIGSVTFGQKSKRRLIPGIGTSRKPELADPSLLDDIVFVSELETIRTCRRILKQYGILIGGSSGSALAGITKYQRNIPSNSVVASVSPDFGKPYIDTIYNDNWVRENFGANNNVFLLNHEKKAG